MTQDVTTRVLQLFRVRLKNNPEISEATVQSLLEGQRENDFGDDDELLTAIVGPITDDA